MQLNLSPETITPWLELLGVLGTGLLAFGGMWWKFANWLKAKEDFQDETNKQLSQLAKVTDSFAAALTAMTVKLEEREKDIMKLEGALDAQRKDMIGVITALQKTAGSLDALWKTLQNQNQALLRLSDK